MSALCGSRVGTRAGWNVHVKAGDVACQDCNDVNTAYARMYRRRLIFEGTRDLIERRPELADLTTVGVGVVDLWRTA